jgi:DNA-directed RNA polymerase specialized sigma24 family protein
MWPEDELCEQWKNAGEEERRRLEPQILAHARRHAEIVVWTRLHERNQDLIELIAEEAVRCLADFRGDARCSTWIEQIALYKVADELRSRYRHPEHRHSEPLELTEVEDKNAPPSLDSAPTVEDQPWFRELTPEEQEHLRLKDEGWTDAEIAGKKDIPVDAAESQWRRLRHKIEKKM